MTQLKVTSSCEQLIEELQLEADEPIASIYCNVPISGDDVPRVADALSKCRRPVVEQGLDFQCNHVTWTTDEFQVILTALAQNKTITGWSFNRFQPPFDDCKANVLSAALNEHPHVRGVALVGAELSDNCMRNLVLAMLNRPIVHEILLPEHAYSSQEVMMQLVRVRSKFPTAALTLGLNQQRHESMLAQLAIHNEDAEHAVRSLQRELLDAFASGDLSHAIDILKTLTQDVALREHERLLQLLPGLLELYFMFGGMELLLSLPPDFDNNAGPGAMGQFIPKPLTAFSADGQVAFLLALSAYKDRELTNVISELEQALAPLSASEDVSASVEALFQKWFLAEVNARMPTYHFGHVPNITPSTSLRVIMGDYTQCGYLAGLPCFVRADEPLAGVGCTYLYRCEASWRVHQTLGSPSWWARLDDKSPSEPRLLPKIEECDKSMWLVGNEGRAPVLLEEREPRNRSLKNAVLEFFRTRSKFEEFLSFKDTVMKTKLAPLKTKGRALDKGAQWLLDTNRCTFIFESPALMVLGFFLFQKIIEAKDGKLVRFNNYFFKDGRPNMAMTKPPCLHINFVLEGWTYEVMFSLQAFIDAKETLHKYFEIVRGKSPLDLLMPIFNPNDVDEAYAEVLHANLPGSKAFGKEAKKEAGYGGELDRPVGKVMEVEAAGTKEEAGDATRKDDEKQELEAQMEIRRGQEDLKISSDTMQPEFFLTNVENHPCAAHGQEDIRGGEDIRRGPEEDKEKLEEEIKRLWQKAEAEEEKRKEAVDKAEAEMQLLKIVCELRKEGEKNALEAKRAAQEEKNKLEEEIKRLQKKAESEEAKRKEEEKKALEAQRAVEEEKKKYKEVVRVSLMGNEREKKSLEARRAVEEYEEALRKSLERESERRNFISQYSSSPSTKTPVLPPILGKYHEISAGRYEYHETSGGPDLNAAQTSWLRIQAPQEPKPANRRPSRH